jgi:hypothetical protein
LATYRAGSTCLLVACEMALDFQMVADWKRSVVMSAGMGALRYLRCCLLLADRSALGLCGLALLDAATDSGWLLNRPEKPNPRPRHHAAAKPVSSVSESVP